MAKTLKLNTFPKKVLNLIAAVALAKANWETVNDADIKTKTEILHEVVFCEEESGNRITNPNSDFLMSEQNFLKYCKLVYEKNCSKGFDSGEPNQTFWNIRKALYDAEDALIDMMGEELPEHYTPEVIKKVKESPKTREKFLNIIGL